MYHETFDTDFVEPPEWTEDTYQDDIGPFDENGDFFIEKGGDDFTVALDSFKSFRKSYQYGADGWLTVELYGRDSNKDGVPEYGGTFENEDDKAKLVSTRHYDGAIIRSTDALPARYRVEVTISNIQFGGKGDDGGWDYPEGKINGYDGDEKGDPWRFQDGDTTPLDAYHENGLYFLCIVDYDNPAPHNNVFSHHHRKVVMDTDNNMGEPPWSYIYNINTEELENDGSRYVSMIWLNGEDFGYDWVGNYLYSYIPRDDNCFLDGAYFADKYIDEEEYVFSVERNEDSYTLSVSGYFYHGGQRTYTKSKKFLDDPVVWHFNQTSDEYVDSKNQVKIYNNQSFQTWPLGSAYPDFFLFGDPHINYYEGSAYFDDLKLYVWVED